MKLEIFEPPICSSTSACEPVVDPQLIQFAADLEWLKARGVEIVRVNHTQHPDAFSQNAAVQQILREKGVDKLPFFFINGRLVGTGLYPSRNQLALVLDLAAGASSEKLLGGGQSCCGPDAGCSTVLLP